MRNTIKHLLHVKKKDADGHALFYRRRDIIEKVSLIGGTEAFAQEAILGSVDEQKFGNVFQ